MLPSSAVRARFVLLPSASLESNLVNFRIPKYSTGSVYAERVQAKSIS